MSSLTLRASRTLITRRVCRQTAMPTQRTFMVPTAVRQADLVQEMYLRELKNFKPTPVKPSDADAHVQKFTMPAAPKSPEEASIQDELKAYESQPVEIEGQGDGAGGAAAEQDWFMEEEEDEAPAAHH